MDGNGAAAVVGRLLRLLRRDAGSDVGVRAVWPEVAGVFPYQGVRRYTYPRGRCQIILRPWRDSMGALHCGETLRLEWRTRIQ